MHRYQYEAERQDGELIQGIVFAPDLTTAREDVEALLLLPLKVLEIPVPHPKRSLLGWR